MKFHQYSLTAGRTYCDRIDLEIRDVTVTFDAVSII